MDTTGLAAFGIFGTIVGIALLIFAIVYGIIYLALPFYIIAMTNRLTDLLAELQQLRRDIHTLHASTRHPQP